MVVTVPSKAFVEPAGNGRRQVLQNELGGLVRREVGPCAGDGARPRDLVEEAERGEPRAPEEPRRTWRAPASPLPPGPRESARERPRATTAGLTPSAASASQIPTPRPGIDNSRCAAPAEREHSASVVVGVVVWVASGCSPSSSATATFRTKSTTTSSSSRALLPPEDAVAMAINPPRPRTVQWRARDRYTPCFGAFCLSFFLFWPKNHFNFCAGKKKFPFGNVYFSRNFPAAAKSPATGGGPNRRQGREGLEQQEQPLRVAPGLEPRGR